MARKGTGKAILDRIDKRLKALDNMSDNHASEQATGNRDALRTIRKQLKSGKQRGISSETVAKFVPVLRTTLEWLLTGVGIEDIDDDHIESSAILPDLVPDADGVEIVGYVGAGAQAHRYAVGQSALERVPRPVGATEKTVAVEIMGDSLGEMFDRWLVFYDDVKRPFTAELLGKLCVVGLSDDRVLVKKIRRAKSGQRNRFDLLSNTEAPIENVEITWAAKVKQMTPQ